MTRRALVYALALTLLLSALLPLSVAADEAPPGRPSSMAATGDSITRAFNLCFFPFSDCPARSWSTGNNSTVNSHARRLGITGSAFNDAVSGARMANLPDQMATVASRNVEYVTILMGGNDVCTDTEAGMTDPDAYEASFRQAMEVLRLDDVQPLVYVVSIPNVKVLWEVLKDNSSARNAWNSYDICQSLLANPLSTDPADVDRRERVKQRNMELNQRLREVCEDPLYSFCRFDGEGIFGTPFVPSDVSTRDYFHPSTDGQAKLARVSYGLGYWGSETTLQPVNSPPTAQFTAPSCTVGVACSFVDASSDSDGIGGSSWNFGDGRTSDQSTASHTFAEAGTYTVTLYSIDARGATARTTRDVSVAPATGGDLTPPAPPANLTATAGDASVALAWGDNTEHDLAGYAVHRSEAAGGPYTKISGDSLLTAAAYEDASVNNGTTYYYVVTASDTAGNTSGNSNEAWATPAGGGGELPAMHIGDLDGASAAAARGNSWTATVTVHVVDASGAGLQGAEVSGNWTTGGSATCTTGSDGRCDVSVSLNSKKVTSTTFIVGSVTLTGYEYDQAANDDPEEDSDGTSIIVSV